MRVRSIPFSLIFLCKALTRARISSGGVSSKSLISSTIALPHERDELKTTHRNTLLCALSTTYTFGRR